MDKREILQQQINDFMGQATQRPGEQDAMGMVGFAATLLAAQMQVMLLQSDETEPGTLEVGEGDEQA